MSILFDKSVETRAISFQSWWGAGDDNPTSRGDAIAVALSVIPVYAATGLIADQIAASPWAMFEKSSGIPVKAETQPDLIVNPGLSGLDVFSWKHQMITSLLLRGNAYGFIASIDSFGLPSRVLWLQPDKVRVDETGSAPVYTYNGAEIDRSRLIHIPWYVLPGSIVGLSPIGLFRMQIESGIEAQRVSKNFFRRGMVPSGFLRNTAKSMTAVEAQETKKRFSASVSATEPFVSGADWEYKAIGLPASDVAFLTGIKATATQVAAIYRVAPEELGGEVSGSSLTYKNLEQDQIRFNIRTLRPLAARVEAVINGYMTAGRYLKFNLDASVRADIKTRFEAHAIAIQNDFETRDEVRALEDRPPLTDQDIEQIKDLRKPTTIGNTP